MQTRDAPDAVRCAADLVKRRHFPCLPSSVPATRRFLRSVWREVPDEVVLVVGELAANALEHAGTEFEVCLDRRFGTCRVGVRDWAPALWPRRRVATDLCERGRGLGIVATLADRWGWTVANGSKVVWFDLGSPAPAQPAGGQITARASLRLV